jgi:hypothetical protein
MQMKTTKLAILTSLFSLDYIMKIMPYSTGFVWLMPVISFICQNHMKAYLRWQSTFKNPYCATTKEKRERKREREVVSTNKLLTPKLSTCCRWNYGHNYDEVISLILSHGMKGEDPVTSKGSLIINMHNHFAWRVGKANLMVQWIFMVRASKPLA